MNTLTFLDGAFGTRIWDKTGESKPVWMYNILRPEVIREGIRVLDTAASLDGSFAFE